MTKVPRLASALACALAFSLACGDEPAPVRLAESQAGSQGNTAPSEDTRRANGGVAAALPLDYVAFGPIFGTRSKASPYDARGVPALAEVVRIAAPRPVVAIGGIDAAGAAAAIGAGAAGVAVISAVAGADDPVAATRRLASLFPGARTT